MKYRRKTVMKKMASLVLATATVLSIMPVSAVMANDQNVAKVGMSEYSDIKSAWNAVKKGGTIELLKDWNTENIGRLCVDEKATVTINLNGHIVNRHIASDNYAKSTDDGEVFFVAKGANVTINGGEGTTHNGRLSNGIWYEDSSATSTNIKGGIIAGGNSTNGAGGIHMKDNSTVTLNDVTVAGNMADKKYGGGVRIKGSNGTLILNKSKIMYNAAKGYGGGVYVDSTKCSITLNDASEISYNIASNNDGGGIYSNDDYTTVKMDKDSQISHNYAKGKGGGIYFNYSKVAVQGGTFDGNQANGGGGGAIYLQHYSNLASTDSAAISDVRFINNQTNGKGGAIRVEQENAIISSCTFENNRSGDVGGAVYIYNDDDAIKDCEIKKNTSQKDGGGVYVESSDNLLLGEKVIVKENSPNNIKLNGNYLINPPGRGSEIGITVKNVGDRFTSGTGFIRNYFFSDNKKYHVDTKDYGHELYILEGEEEGRETINVGTETTTVQRDGKDVVKGYFSYPSFLDTQADLDGVFYYSDSYFDKPTEVNSHLATMSMCLAMSAFNSNVGNDAENGTDYTLKSKNVVKLLTDIGVNRNDIYLSNTYTVKPGTGTIGVAIGKKKLSTDSNDGTILVPVAIRGAGYESEWTSNVTIGAADKVENGEHAGFADAANQVFTQVQEYIENHDLSEAVKNGKVKFWVTGYSRAGATANLTARRLVDKYGTNNVFAYCMEAPQGALAAKNNTTKYKSIHNYINYLDPVPKVAPAYMDQFTRYGSDEVFNIFAENSKTSSDFNQRKTAINQLAAVCPDINYDDSFTVGTIDLFEASILNSYMVRSVTTPTDKAPKNGGEFMDVFIAKFKDWAVPDRASFINAPVAGSDKDLRENGSNLRSVSFEEALQLVMPMVFTKSDEEIEELMTAASNIANEMGLLEKLHIYNGPILGNWTKQSKATKQQWLWDELWYKMIEVKGKDCVATKLSAQELENLKTAWPTLMDTLFNFVSNDYNFDDWALAFTVVGNQVVQRYADPGLNVLGSLAYNANSLMQAHYPEVNYAWLRSMDTYYTGDYSTSENKENRNQVKIQTDDTQTPEIKFSLDETEYYTGDQTLELSVNNTSDKDNKGTAIYYKLTTKVDGQETTSDWMPYNGSILLPVGVKTDAAGKEKKINAEYTIEAKAIFGDKESSTTKTYVIHPEPLYKIIIKDEEGNIVSPATGEEAMAYAPGERVTVSVPEQDGKFFTQWDILDGVVTKSNQKDKTITFTMPKKNIELTADYENLIDTINVTDLQTPVGEQPFKKTANLVLSSGNKQIETLTDQYAAWSRVYRDQDGEVHEIVGENAKYNTTYEAIAFVHPEEGVREFADNITVCINGEPSSDAKVETKNDGSIWIYCGKVTTGNPKYKEIAREVKITAKAGTEEAAMDKLGLPDKVWILTDNDLYRYAPTAEGWVCKKYNGQPCTEYDSTKGGTYIFEAILNLSECGVDLPEGTSEVVAQATVSLEEQAKAAVPTLKDNSPSPGKYKEQQTIYLETATQDATIMYKINGGKEETYDAQKGITLQSPEDKTAGVNKTYIISAYTKRRSEEEKDSDEIELKYEVVNPYTVTISYKDTGYKDADGKGWTREDTTATYFPGEKITIYAPEESDEQFEKWVTSDDSGIELSKKEKTNKLIQVDKIENDIKLTAVYNPIVKAIDLSITSPQTGEKLAKTVSGCKAIITQEYDVLEAFGQTIPIKWTPEGNDGAATAYQSYTAKMTMSMNSDAAKFYVNDKLQLTVKDAENEAQTIPSTWTIEENEGKNVLVVYAIFSQTSKVKAISVEEPKSIQADHGTAEEEILQRLPGNVQVNLADGTVTQATVSDWKFISTYDPSAIDAQTVTAEGTLAYPSYVDGNGLNTVTTKVYVAGAERTTTPTASVAGGIYTEDQNVTLSADDGADIYYTTDGSEPTTASQKYDGNAIVVASDVTILKAIAVKEGMQNSMTASYTYYVHHHKDENGDGKCDGILMGTDAKGQPIYKTCDTVFLGHSSNDQFITSDTVQSDGKGTIYVKVNDTDMAGYSTENYPTTKLKYDYSTTDNDEKVTTVQHGYIFAGWYKPQEATDENGDGGVGNGLAACDSVPADEAYAKFVDDTVLQSKAQILAKTKKDSEKTNMRFLSSVDCLNYKEIGFKIEIQGKSSITEYSTNQVAKRVYESDGTIAESRDPKDIFENNLSIDFFAFTINNIPNSAFDDEMKATAYWITLDGTKVYGKQASRIVNNMIK